jgi:hypothetical protein
MDGGADGPDETALNVKLAVSVFGRCASTIFRLHH